MAELLKNIARVSDTVQLGINAPLHQEEALTESMPLSEHEQLLTESYQAGMTAGIQQAREQMQESMQALDKLLNSIPQAICANRAALSNEVADIVLMIVRQFFINQQLHPEAISAQINQLLAELNEKQAIELLLHPGDIALLQQGVLKLTAHAHHNLRILPCEELALGGCMIRSDHGMFDASIERQIDSLKQVLTQIKQGKTHA